MKRYQLNLEESDGIIKKAKNLERRFQSAKIKNLLPPVIDVVTMQNLKALTISCCTLDLSLVAKALKNLKMLEELNATGVHLEKDIEDDIEKISFRKLTSLLLHLTDPELVAIFDVISLKRFNISNYLKTECSNVIKLLQQQPNLKDLSVGGTISGTFFESPEIMKFPFHLKDLRIDGSNRNLGLELDFLQAHSATIERLDIQFVNCCAFPVYQYAIQNLPKLNHLQLAISQFTTQNLSNFSQNQNVKNLTILGWKNLAAAKKCIDLFTSLERLDLQNVSMKDFFTEFLLHISQTKKQLKSLAIPYLTHHEGNAQINFPELREFSVSHILNYSIYEKFVQRHAATLERICIQFVSDKMFVQELTINSLMACPNLKHLTIGCESPLIIRMVNKKVQRPLPWTFEGRIKSPLDSDHIVLKFKFPDDLAVWEERCRIYDDELIRDFSTLENYGTNVFVNKYK